MIQNGQRITSRLYTVTLKFKLYAEYIIRNARLDDEQVGIKIGGRNISNLRHADYTPSSEEELKSCLMKVKE